MMKRESVVKDVQCGSIRAMLIQPVKRKKKQGWLFYPSMIASTALVVAVGLSGNLFTPAGMVIGTACLAWWGVCAVANVKVTSWGAR